MTLFLEFDGAHYPDRCVAQFKFCQRNLIEGILREFPQVDIVLSTTWRLRYPRTAEICAQTRAGNWEKKLVGPWLSPETPQPGLQRAEGDQV